MSGDFLDRIDKLSPQRLKLLALELHEQVEAAAARTREPIAVIGMGCRFPGGADDPARFWSLLSEGRDAIREVPRDRWEIDGYFDPDPDAPGRMSVRSGGFLDRVDGFDAGFFGITPREALTMDPQQRMLLEVTWEALEHAGLAADRLAGSQTGVFVGICNSDYFHRLLHRGDEAIDAYLASGSAHSVAAGRIAYVLGFQGPALSIDTACSSSLVALNAACQSLRLGETAVAVCGGVNVMCSPETTIALTKAHMLAPDGRCKTFDARADGFSRGEGCGVLILKRLSDAQRDGDRVLAVVRGTAVNQDGRSGGLTVPNGPAQEAVIRAALADAGVSPSDIDYVEAHGTGTSLGDPIEVRALAGALGAGRPADRPLWIGSVKTNIGHLESAAGIAGVMKVVLSLQHERIPPHLHFSDPSSHIDWSSSPIEVTSNGRPWKRQERPRRAGVSSFGFSGTNAHVVIEEAPHSAVSAPVQRPLHCIPLSARSTEALRQLAGRHAEALTMADGPALVDLAHTAGAGRSHFTERLAVVAGDASSASASLQAFADGQSHDVHRGTATPGRTHEVVFLFTGQGAQYPGMANALYDGSTVFRKVIDDCDAVLGPDAAGRTLKSVLWSLGGDNPPIHETAWTQPALFAVEYGLAQLWRSWGIEPAAVLGHSVGEYVAACVAGVFSLEDGLRLIAERGRLMQALPPGGSMAAIFAPVSEVAAAVAPMARTLSIAAINASDSVVVSGAAESVDALLADFERRNVKGHRLFVSLAAHSPLVDPALDAMEACARRVTMHKPSIPVAWNLTGSTALPSDSPDATYWRRHLREPVRFADGIQQLHRDGYTTFLEVGPHPTLIALAQRSLPDTTVFLTSLRRGKDDWHELMTSVARLYVSGAPVKWEGVGRDLGARPVSLPTYPFERRSYWIDPSAPSKSRTRPTTRSQSPLLGARLATAAPIFELTLTPDSPAYLADHLVQGAPLVAGPVYLEMVQSCAREIGASGAVVEEFAIHQPLIVGEMGRTVQVHIEGGRFSESGTPFSVHSRPSDGSGDWELHATGRLVAAGGAGRTHEPPSVPDGSGLLPCDDYYARLLDLGIDLRASFRTLREARRVDGRVVSRIELPASRLNDIVSWAHPALMDGALQSVGLALPESAGSDIYLFTGVDRVQVSGPLPSMLWCETHLRDPHAIQPKQWLADVVLRDSDGVHRGEIQGVCVRRTTREALRHAVGGRTENSLFYQIEWESLPPSLRAAGRLQDPEQFVPLVRDQFTALARSNGMSIYDDLLPQLDRLSAGHVSNALRELRFDARPGRTFTLESEAATLRIVERHRRLFGRLMQMLVEDGVLRRRGDRFEVVGALSVVDLAASYDGAFARFGDVDGELRTLYRCGGSLARVLTGDQDPLQLLFPGGSLTEARKLYVESPYARTYNGTLAEALKAALASLPGDRRLRVLEIGAGTGGTTTYVLPLLPKERVEYTFTDLSPLFLERAAEQFAQYDFMRRAILDIERDPVAQGFDRGRYDVVIAANVLHATADLQKTLEHARALMSSEGLLLLLEGVAPERWVDLTFGLTEGWWRFTDTALRQDYPLIGRGAWMDLLRSLGFTSAVSIPGDEVSSRGAAQQALIVARAPIRRRRWAVVGEVPGVSSTIVSRLVERGDLAAQVSPESLRTAGVDVDDIVCVEALNLATRAADDMRALESCRRLVSETALDVLAACAGSPSAARVWLVTQGAMPVGDATASGARWQAPLWGLGRVFALEQPARWGGLIDLPTQASGDALVTQLLEAIDAEDGEDQVALRNGQRLAARLTPTQSPPGQTAAVRFQPDATYLVTGGFGGLGLVVARWMVEQGARSVALLGRTPDPHAPAVRELEARGARVTCLQGDVADERRMTQLLGDLDAQGPPLRGIMHAAADLSVAPIGELTSEQVSRMLRPKLDGTLLLERLTRDRELDFLVLFSSSTALLGAGGYAHYAAANLFLDATAMATSRPRRRVLSVNWGTWEVMRLATAENQRSYRESGLRPMASAAALDALGNLLRATAPQMMVADIDWGMLKPLHEARRIRPFLSRMGAEPVAVKASAQTSAPALIDRWRTTPVDLRREVLLAFVSDEVTTVLALDRREPVPLETGLFELGMDSLMSVELRRRLEQGVGQPLPSTLTFNYPNVSALATFINGQLQSSIAATEPVAESSVPVAVVVPANEALDSLSDEELEARLLARLEQAR
jgi:acyl transferase domain-containing protein/acyl carrier protein